MRPADFTYHYSFRCAAGTPVEVPRFGGLDYPFALCEHPVGWRAFALRQEPSSLYTFPRSCRGLARDYHQRDLLRLPRI